MKLRFQKQRFTFTANLQDGHFSLVVCPITGITISMAGPQIPTILEQKNPLSLPSNALNLIKTCQKTKQWDKVEIQVMAGLALSLLNGQGKIANYPNSSATEANMLLQNAGHNALRHLLVIIAERWDSDQTWVRMPKLSLNLSTYEYPAIGMTSVISQYTRLISKALIVEDLGSKDATKIWDAWKENSKTKGEKYTKRIDATISRAKIDTFDRQWDHARALYSGLAETMPLTIKGLVRSTIQNLNIYFEGHRKNVAKHLREYAATLPDTEENKTTYLALADTIENAHNTAFDDEAFTFSEQVSPIVKSEKENVAAKLAARLAEIKAKGMTK